MYGRTGWKTLLSGAALYDAASWQGISPTVHQSTAIKFNSKTKTDRGNSLEYYLKPLTQSIQRKKKVFKIREKKLCTCEISYFAP